MKFIYPQSILTPRLPDEMFVDEANAFSGAGYSISLLDSERLLTASAKIKPPLDTGDVAIYRGWMLSPTEYDNFVRSVTATGAIPFTSTEKYLATHYLPNWYGLISDLTPETVVLSLEADWVTELTKLGWTRFFVNSRLRLGRCSNVQKIFILLLPKWKNIVARLKADFAFAAWKTFCQTLNNDILFLTESLMALILRRRFLPLSLRVLIVLIAAFLALM
jgi:hypothetical protein